MSLNKYNQLELHQGEIVVQKHNNVEIKFKNVKYSCEHIKGTKKGKIFLTNFRIFFVNDKKNDMMRNFSMPFKYIKNFDIKQPVFGANYLEGQINAEAGGGWEGSADFEITFKDGGAVETGQKLMEMAKNPQMMYIANPAPVIVGGPIVQGYPVAGSSNGMYFPAQQPTAPYMAPGPHPQAQYGVPPAQYGAPPGHYGPPPPGHHYAPPAPPGYQPAAAPAYYPQTNGENTGTGYSKSEEAAANALPPSYISQNPPPYNPNEGKKDQ